MHNALRNILARQQAGGAAAVGPRGHPVTAAVSAALRACAAGIYPTKQPAIELITELLPDVVLLDVHLPGGGGQAVVHAVKANHPEVRFLALSASDAPEDVIAVIRRPGLRNQDDLHHRTGQRGPPGRGRRRGVLAPAGRVRP